VGYFYLKESNPAVIEKSRRDEEERTHLLGNGKHFAPANESDIKTSMPKSGSINKITMASVSVIIAYSYGTN
jgi:hypothetical protein